MNDLLHKPVGGNDYAGIELSVRQFPRSYTKSLSVVVPHFRGRILLERCLFGLTNQSYPHHLMEVVVSDDGSSCELVGIEQMFRSALNLRMITHERNGYRLATVRNRGILASEGEVVVCLDCDVIPVPELIESHLRWFHVGGEKATIGPRKFIDVCHIRPSDVPRTVHQLRSCPDIPSASNRYLAVDKRWPEFQNFKKHPHPYNCFHGCNVAFRRDRALEIGLFDEEFNGRCGYEDIEFGYRLYKAGQRLVFEPEALALHQENTVISAEQRALDGEVNRRKLYSKVPELERYRRELGGQ